MTVLHCLKSLGAVLRWLMARSRHAFFPVQKKSLVGILFAVFVTLPTVAPTALVNTFAGSGYGPFDPHDGVDTNAGFQFPPGILLDSPMVSPTSFPSTLPTKNPFPSPDPTLVTTTLPMLSQNQAQIQSSLQSSSSPPSSATSQAPTIRNALGIAFPTQAPVAPGQPTETPVVPPTYRPTSDPIMLSTPIASYRPTFCPSILPTPLLSYEPSPRPTTQPTTWPTTPPAVPLTIPLSNPTDVPTPNPTRSNHEPCPAGYYSVSQGGGGWSCVECSPGTYGSGRYDLCQLCPAGTTSMPRSTSLDNCWSCSSGTFAAIAGSSSCSPCDVGHYTASTGSTSCSLCDPGHFASNIGSSLCSACTPGTLSSLSGMSSCGLCPLGTYASGAASACTQCSPGQFGSRPGLSTCSYCEAGTFSATRGSFNCSSCGEGTYAPNTGLNSCSLCPPGYSSFTASSSCPRVSLMETVVDFSSFSSYSSYTPTNIFVTNDKMAFVVLTSLTQSSIVVTVNVSAQGKAPTTYFPSSTIAVSGASPSAVYGYADSVSLKLFISDITNKIVWQIDTQHDSAIAYAGGGSSKVLTGTQPAKSVLLGRPEGVFVTSHGDLYICDNNKYVIRKVDSAGSMTTAAGSGQYGYVDSNLATAAQMRYPTGIIGSPDGENVFVTDNQNDVIRKLSGGSMTTYAGNNQPFFSGDGGQATFASLYGPQSAALSTSGDLYVADTLNDVIRRVISSGVITTFAGIGQYGGDQEEGYATSTLLNQPQGVFVSPDGDVYVADTANKKIRKYTYNCAVGYIVKENRCGICPANTFSNITGAKICTHCPGANCSLPGSSACYAQNSTGCNLNSAEATVSRFSTTDFKALVTIYEFGKHVSSKISQWVLNSTLNPCTGGVEGIVCDSTNSYVTSLDLRGANLTGPIPDAIGSFESLQYLYLANNGFSTSIPSSLARRPNLVWIDLSNNNLTDRIPRFLAILPKLRWLDLSSNRLTGSIPDSLAQLGFLQALLVNNNSLTGQLPPVPKNLFFLNVNQNKLTGAITTILSSSSLFYCDLSFNRFSGSVPSSLFAFANIKYLFLQSNALSGKLVFPPRTSQYLVTLDLASNLLSGSIPSALGDFAVLSDLFLSNNSFAGSIPTSLSNLQYLQYLDVNTNKLNGAIPPALGNLSNLVYLLLNDNAFHGSVPATICGLRNLVILDLSNNQFGHMCSFSSSNESSTEVSTVTLLMNDTRIRSSDINHAPTISATVAYPSLAHVRLSGNAWVESERNLLTMMSKFVDVPSLKLLALDFCSLYGPMPLNMAPFRNLSSLNLSHNSISGSLPSSLGVLQKLTTIDLTNNAVTGTLPLELGQIENIGILKLCKNFLSGSIPLEFSALEKLRVLDLSSNQLNGKMRFIDASKQKALQFIDVSENYLTGVIPSDVFRLKNLSVFSASSNCFYEAHLSKDICYPDSNIEVIAMDGINQGGCSKLRPFFFQIFPGVRTGLYPYKPPLVTFDDCIFKDAPRLKILHLSSNNIAATLPDVIPSPQLQVVTLSVNRITGIIPEKIQTHPWTDFDVSYNKLYGTLNKGIKNKLGTSFAVEVNRLSGPVPVDLIQQSGYLSILQGNFFSCPVKTEQVGIPERDPFFVQFRCGGGSNVFLLEFAAFSIIFVAVVLLWVLSKVIVPLKRVWGQFINIFVHCKCSIEKSGLEMPNTMDALNVLTDLIWWFGLTACFGVVVMTPVYIVTGSQIFRSGLSQMTRSDVWLASGAFFSGEGAAVIMFMFWSTGILVFTASTRYCFLIGGIGHEPEAELSTLASIKATVKVMPSNLTVSAKLIFVCILNMVVVFLLKSLYIYNSLQELQIATQGSSFVLNMLTLAWVQLLRPLLAWARKEGNDKGIRKSDGENVTGRQTVATTNEKKVGKRAAKKVEESDEIMLHSFLVIFNNMVIPVLAVGFVYPECFWYYFFIPPPVTLRFAWSAGNCLEEVVTPFSINLGSFQTSFQTSRCLTSLSLSTIRYFLPPFNYSNMCSSLILTTYASYFLFSFMVNACGIPLMLLVIGKMLEMLSPANDDNNNNRVQAQGDRDGGKGGEGTATSNKISAASRKYGAEGVDVDIDRDLVGIVGDAAIDSDNRVATADPEHILSEENVNPDAMGEVDAPKQDRKPGYWVWRALEVVAPKLLRPLDLLVQPAKPSLIDTAKGVVGLTSPKFTSIKPSTMDSVNGTQPSRKDSFEGMSIKKSGKGVDGSRNKDGENVINIQDEPKIEANVFGGEDEKSDEEDTKSGDDAGAAPRLDIIINIDENDGSEIVEPALDDIPSSQPSPEATLGDSIPLRCSADTESMSMDAESLVAMIAENERMGIVRFNDGHASAPSSEDEKSGEGDRKSGNEENGPVGEGEVVLEVQSNKTDEAAGANDNLVVPELFPRKMFILRFVGYMAILLTFGTVFPVLGVVIALASCFEVLVNIFMLSLFVSRLLVYEDKVKKELLRAALEKDLAGMRKPFLRSVRLIVPLATLFYSWFLFDMIGDKKGYAQACWGPVLMVLSPFIVGGIFMLVNHFVEPTADSSKKIIDFFPTRRSIDRKSASFDLGEP